MRMAVSLDGFAAGPEQSVKNPLGVRGMDLMQWVFPLKVWREQMGMKGGETNESSQVLEDATTGIGATIMGRNMFGGHPGPWDAGKPWNGWWGENPPYHHPVFVLTHHRREPLKRQGGTTFFFVTDGIESALDQARKAAGGKDITLAGGANACQQYLKAGLVDEMWLHISPVLLGRGERLFDSVEDLKGLRLERTVAAPDVTHLKFAHRSN